MQATEMRLEVQEVLRDKKRMIDSLASFTGRPTELITKDFKRDFYLNAQEAADYGIIDKVIYVYICIYMYMYLSIYI